MIWPTLSILIALGVAAIITTPNKPPERTHIYWCYVVAFQEWQSRVWRHEIGLPCMYRTNTPIGV